MKLESCLTVDGMVARYGWKTGLQRVFRSPSLFNAVGRTVVHLDFCASLTNAITRIRFRYVPMMRGFSGGDMHNDSN
jgi:hypothetical protein